MEDPNSCITALVKYGTYWGPWLPHSAELPFVPTPSASLVPKISYLDSFWHPPTEPVPVVPSKQVTGSAGSSWMDSVAVVFVTGLVVGICFGVGRRLTTCALNPKAGAEELIEMKNVEIS